MKKSRLSPQQLRVVEHVDGALLVVAGPGSGKTRVVTERVRHLLSAVPGHFRVLALTFTNKAANEMKERLSDLGDDRQRAFIGTLHSFCSSMLSERGRFVGVDSLPQIFEQFQDRMQVLTEAATEDPMLAELLGEIEGEKARSAQVARWLERISWIKSHPLTCAILEDSLDICLLEAYNAGLRACGVYDFDDLLLLAYRLLSENPSIADFYRRLYRFVCIDEAQDLNEAQYAVITSFCGEDFRNILMVGDPKQSIYGFNTSDPKYMKDFLNAFQAEEIELSENFRSSRVVIEAARALEPSYMVAAQLPIVGQKKLLIGLDEADEARKVIDEIEHLVTLGHEDVEGEMSLSSCAILGRTRYTLIPFEVELEKRGIPFYKRLSSNLEYESKVLNEFHTALRVVANPRDRLHLSSLLQSWGSKSIPTNALSSPVDVADYLTQVANSSKPPRVQAIVLAVKEIAQYYEDLPLMRGIEILRNFADTLGDDDRNKIYEDTAVLSYEWDQFLRSDSSPRTIPGFMSGIALGNSHQANREGIALLTVHSSKGLEFDAVFVGCMAEGVFPDYRARGKSAQEAEERRDAFVAVTRSKRLLYFSFPKRRMMPWGEEKIQYPSQYLRLMGLVD